MQLYVLKGKFLKIIHFEHKHTQPDFVQISLVGAFKNGQCITNVREM